MFYKSYRTNRGVVAILCTAAAWLLACRADSDTQQQDRPVAATAFTAREAPCTDVQVKQMVRVDTETQQTAVDRAFEVFGIRGPKENEVHDCQRLVGHGSRPPLVALWAFENLFTSNLANYTPIVGIATQDGKYPRLGLNTAASCLFMRKGMNAEGKDWEAYIVALSDTTERCSNKTSDEITKGKKLKVARVDPDQSPGANDPKGARIEEHNGHYYIGVSCIDDKWCIVGVGNAGVKPGGWSSRNDAKGDEQMLSIKNQDDTWQRSNLRARISPASNLDAITDSEFARDFQTVASITFKMKQDDPAEEHYAREKFKLNGTTLHDPVLVQLKGAGTSWEIRYISDADTGKAIPARYMPGNVMSPKSVRWRWSESDEGVWVQCHNGCCGDG